MSLINVRCLDLNKKLGNFRIIIIIIIIIIIKIAKIIILLKRNLIKLTQIGKLINDVLEKYKEWVN